MPAKGMWKSLKALGATSTQGHVSIQAPQDAEELYLPDSSVYVTKTKSGKPAIARKKNDSLLQKHGFDVLGQSFGIPSRVDYERDVLVDTPPRQTARRRSFSVSPSDQEIEVYINDGSSPPAKLKPAHRKRTSPPSSTEKRFRRKPEQTAMYPENLYQPTTTSTQQGHHRRRSRSMSQSTTSSSARDSRKQMIVYKSDDDDEDTDSEITQSSASFYLPPPPPPPHIPRQDNKACYPTHQAMAAYPPAIYPMASNGYSTAQGPPGAPFPGLYYTQHLPQCPHATSSSMYPRGFAMNQPGPLPVASQLPQQQLMNPATYIPPVANFATGPVPPPPPPPPPPPIVQAEVAPRSSVQAEVGIDKTVSVGGDEPAHENNPSNGQQKHEPSLEHSPKQSLEQKNKTLTETSVKDQGKLTTAQVGEKSSSFPYKHVCAGCGKTRSNGYHMTHRLKKGETPEPDYCRRCITTAAFTDSDGPSMSGNSQLFVSTGPISSSRSSGAESQIRKGHYIFDDRSRRHKLHKKPRRRSFLRSFLRTASTPHHTLGSETRSLSSAEEASSRASSLAPGHRIRRKTSLVSTERSSHRRRNATPATETSASKLSSKSSGTHKSHNAPRHGYRDMKENDSKPRKLPKVRVEQTTVSTMGNEQEMPVRKNMSYKRPTVRNEASELANRASDSNTLDHHTDISARSYEGLSHIPSYAFNERSGFSGATSPVQGPPANMGINATRSLPAKGNSKDKTRIDVEQLLAQKKASDIEESSRAKQSTGNPDETMFPELISLLQKEEANAFGEYDSSPRGPIDGFDSVPPTPTDPVASIHTAHPRVVNDSWENEQSHFEKMAEELAEEDLMRAGKRSGLFGSSRDSSAVSSNPFLSNLTPSSISIESCPSDEERNDGNDHYEMAIGGVSDGEEDTVASENSPKQLEFSSSEDHVRKTADRSYYADNVHNVKTTKNHLPTARNLYNNYDMESTISSHSSDFRPPADGSSLLAHTGHSMEDVPFAVDTRAPRRRVRRFGGLLRP